MKAGSRSEAKVRMPALLLGLVVVLVALAVGPVACTDLTTSSISDATAGPGTTLVTSSSEPPSTETTLAPTTTTAPPAVSALSEESLNYARSLGGTDHYGETLYFVIGDEARTEEGAKALLEPAKAVGDMQSNFIVQLSDNFEGMRPGYWIVFEAYDGYPSEEDLIFCRRPFPHAYMHHSRVLTHDPIPVRPGG